MYTQETLKDLAEMPKESVLAMIAEDPSVWDAVIKIARCEHEYEPNTTMTMMRCEHCGREAPRAA